MFDAQYWFNLLCNTDNDFYIILHTQEIVECPFRVMTIESGIPNEMTPEFAESIGVKLDAYGWINPLDYGELTGERVVHKYLREHVEPLAANEESDLRDVLVDSIRDAIRVLC